MKKILSMLLAVMMLAGLFAVSASAEDDVALSPEQKIERVVLSGFADMPYDLTAPVSRLEAAVCVVLMLGDEDFALDADDVTVPFTDVSVEFAPYIAYLYDYGYTNGVSDTLFGSDLYASFAQFYTFVLRALGYAEGEDFTYATVLDDARDLGIIDDYTELVIASGDSFKVEDLLIAMYNGLDALICDSDVTLIEALYDAEAISDTAFELFCGTNELYNYLFAPVDIESMTMSATYDIAMSSFDEDLGSVSAIMDCYVVIDDGIPTIMMDMIMSADGAEDQLVSVYMDASGLYIGLDDEWISFADMIDVGGEEVGALTGGLDIATIMSLTQDVQAIMGDFSILEFIEGLTLDLVDDNAVISGVIDMSWAAALYESMLGDDFMIDIEPIEFEFVIDGTTMLPISMWMNVFMSMSFQGVPMDTEATIDAEIYDYDATEIDIPDGLALLLDAA